MRKREIHSVAHWAMMFLLLMFPILMVGLSVFDKKQENTVVSYEENPVSSPSDLVLNDVYHFNSMVSFSNETTQNTGLIGVSDLTNIYSNNPGLANNAANVKFVMFYYSVNGTALYYFDENQSNIGSINTISYPIQFDFRLRSYSYLLQDTSFIFVQSVYNSSDYKSDINSWIDAFIDLPINSWYKSLMTVIGVGFTNSTVMNVIYVMPVYILWVFIFDVIVDCFLVIIKLPHKLLNRLSGGENE